MNPSGTPLLISSTLPGSDGTPLHLVQWETEAAPRAVVQIVHGMSEHAARYDGLAQALTAAGYAVYGNDHRGHGRTAPTPGELGYFGDAAGWRACVDDLAVVQRRMGTDHPGVPLVLLGHSMGAFLAQQLAGEQGEALAGLVLSGSYRESPLVARCGAMLARVERLRLGRRGHSRLINALTFGAFNRRFAPTRTAFDWLSRDEAEVDRYLADPHCGFPPSVQMWIEVLDGLAAGLPSPPSRLPVCIMNGDLDPVCAADATALKLVASFRDAGIDRIAQCIYPDARHELFHETNREEVAGDLISWLDRIGMRGENLQG
jgi:alpha-beta hydrolase superfamily lysophospholipase